MKKHERRRRWRPWRIVTVLAAIVAASAIAVTVGLHDRSADATGPLPVHLPTTPQSYLGVYANPAPVSYAGVTAFTKATTVWPDVIMYYSGWYESFQASLATTAAEHGAVPLVQLDPGHVRDRKSVVEGKSVDLGG